MGAYARHCEYSGSIGLPQPGGDCGLRDHRRGDASTGNESFLGHETAIRWNREREADSCVELNRKTARAGSFWGAEETTLQKANLRSWGAQKRLIIGTSTVARGRTVK